MGWTRVAKEEINELKTEFDYFNSHKFSGFRGYIYKSDSLDGIEELAKKLGGKVVETQESSGGYITLIGFDKANITKPHLDPDTCFIATAAYGTPTASELNHFRRFRDERLLEDRLGEALVNTYYRLSPPLAKVISMSSGLRYLTRKVLNPIAKHLKE